MGRETERVEILFSVSDHNDEQDDIDRAVVDDFRAAVGALLALPRYAELNPDSNGCEAAYRDMEGDQLNRVRMDLSTAAWEVRERTDLTSAYAVVVERDGGI